MPDKTKKHEVGILDSWKELQELFKDGKIDPVEVPPLLRALSTIIEFIASIFAALKLDPKVMVIMTIVKDVLRNIGDALEKQIPKIEEAWKKLDEVFKDDKITEDEVPKFLEGLAELFEALWSIIVPFATPEFNDNAEKIAVKISKLNEWVKSKNQ